MSDPEPFLALITPVDPDGQPDQSLPPMTGHPLPEPPSGVWPPLPPDLPVQLPAIGWKPGTIWPPLNPPTVTPPIAPEPPEVGGGPAEPPPTVGGGPVMPPTPTLPEGVLVLLAWVPGHGFRWVVVDTTLKPDNSLPSQPPVVAPPIATPPPVVTPPIETPPDPTVPPPTPDMPPATPTPTT